MCAAIPKGSHKVAVGRAAHPRKPGLDTGDAEGVTEQRPPKSQEGLLSFYPYAWEPPTHKSGMVFVEVLPSIYYNASQSRDFLN